MFLWIKARLREHFGFSKTETNGTLVLLLLTSICLLVSQSLKWYYSVQPESSHDQDIALLERTLSLLEARVQRPKHTHKKPQRDLDHPQSPKLFDINTAGEAQLSAIKGIGPVLSARIVKFRAKLGGFISQAQYQEVYGLLPEVVARLKKHTYIGVDFQSAKLNINTADVPTLASHPYLTYQQAQSIVRYRAQHGPFLTTESLRVLELIDEATLKKLNPYLCALQ
jgi:DNA uptake protein ComE-like DNA-binding protein